MTRRFWTPSEDAILRDLYATHSACEIADSLGRRTNSVWNRAQLLGLRKPIEWIRENSRQSAARNSAFRATQFVAGIVPWNKGINYTAGGRSAETRFRTGGRHGKAVGLWKPIGSLRINVDGYLERKINDDKPIHKRWRAEHLLIWESVNGPLPRGHAIAFRDGDKTNLAQDNLELVTRAEMMRRNTFRRHGPEVAALTQLRGALTRQINRRTRGEHPGNQS